MYGPVLSKLSARKDILGGLWRLNASAAQATRTASLRVMCIERFGRESSRTLKGGEGRLGAGFFGQTHVLDAITKHLF